MEVGFLRPSRTNSSSTDYLRTTTIKAGLRKAILGQKLQQQLRISPDLLKSTLGGAKPVAVHPENERGDGVKIVPGEAF